jgi:uncharacterized protein
MKKIFLTWHDVEKQTAELCRQITLSGWRPDYVVGLTRGGLTPANLISQYFEVPMDTLKVSLRDDGETVSNLGMAEDAYNGMNILIVDDINDTGATLNWIKQDWESFHPSKTEPWKTIWNQSVRVAVLYDNESSKNKIDIDYSAVDINKAKKDCWIVFPWESWWK